VSLRLFLDEDATFRSLIRALVARGLDVTNAIDAGRAGLSDAEQLEHAD
jgi:ActR/RegA family two-component response regulator